MELTCLLQSITPREVLVRYRRRAGVSVDLLGGDARVPVRLRFNVHPVWNTVLFETDQPAVRPVDVRDVRRLAFMLRELPAHSRGPAAGGVR